MALKGDLSKTPDLEKQETSATLALWRRNREKGKRPTTTDDEA
jgi:hypothetical protein